MVNVGTYCTKTSIENIKIYNKLKSIDAYLVVNPYYNKPTQTWLFQHFTTLAKATKKPIILYNIKGRTGVNLETNTLIDIISKCPNVIGVKEASGDMIQMKEVIEQTWDHFLVFSGDDGLTYELIQNGGDGVISVASNCIPKKMKDFVDICFKWGEKASKLNEKYQDFFEKLFIQTNPLPAKTFLAEKWIIKENFRLPLCPMDQDKKEEFLKVIKKYKF
jgi:4-hydroxy-tetrahydrodipicolinate synthase